MNSISKIQLIIKALRIYEQVLFGYNNVIGHDAAIDEVLKQMRLEEL